MENGNSRTLFIIDLTIMFTFFFVVFTYYTRTTMIPLKGSILMGLIVIYWFLISVNSNILKISRLSNAFDVAREILIAYSVLSTLTIVTVAIFGEFRPNDKLVLYPLFFGVISSCNSANRFLTGMVWVLVSRAACGVRSVRRNSCIPAGSRRR